MAPVQLLAMQGVLQIFTGEAEFLGAGVSTEKSAELLFVSSQPLLFLKAALIVSIAAVGDVSLQTELPYPTRSSIFNVVGQPYNKTVSLTTATLPLNCPIDMAGLAI